MKLLWLFGLLSFTSSWVGCIPHIAPPGVKLAAASTNVEDPDEYRVDSASYPIFQVKERFNPPRWRAGAGESKYPMVAIEPSDIWRVTHRVGDVFLIYSDVYNDRQCRLLAQLEPHGIAGGHLGFRGKTCQANYLYHISITLNGTVTGGWKLLYNPKRFGFARDRYIRMYVDPSETKEWDLQPLFVPIRSSSTN